MGSENRAAWLHAKGERLKVGDAPMPHASEGEIVIRNRAIAINPVSCKIQAKGIVAKTWPVILDDDVAGEIHEIGAGVDNFRKGDRVVAFVHGPIDPDTKYGGFQLYSVARVGNVAKLPEGVDFAHASVLPIAFNTAIVGLCAPFPKGLGLPPPSLEDPLPSGKTILIWGASSAVGMSTSQVARAAGVRVVAIASPHNFAICKSLGAAAVLDYHSNSIVGETVQAIRATGGDFVGIVDCISLPEDSFKYCIPILEELGGGTLGVLDPHAKPNVSNKIGVAHIFGMGEFTHAFYKDYLTPALESGKHKCLPEPMIVGEGLELLQKGLDILQKGVSGSKVVVTL